MAKTNVKPEYKTIKTKIEAYCAFQDRCKQEVTQKLYTLGANKEEIEKLVKELIDDRFLNEERFVKAFVSGKLHLKKWGVNKIKQALMQKGISDILIKDALSDIEQEDYMDKLKIIAQKKWEVLKDPEPAKNKAKLIRFLLSKGYEYDKIKEVIKGLKKQP